MQILDGKLVAQQSKVKVAERAASFEKKKGRRAHLVVMLIGSDPASQVYVRNKVKTSEALGIRSTLLNFANLTQAELQKQIRLLNEDDGVDGVLVQLPLPKGLDAETVFSQLRVDKDVDGLTHLNQGLLQAGKQVVASCTPQGIITLLKHYHIELKGKDCVVVGRSQIVGLPMAQLLLQADATVTVCHSKTRDLRAHTQKADLVVVAAGRPHLLSKEDFKRNAVVVDVGIHGSGSGGPLRGDVKPVGLDGWLSASTPVPGGVGPMTIATLLENVMTLAEKRAAL